MINHKPLVNFIGIGAQKCGTTWIHSNLCEHPELAVATGKDKDTQFFSCYYDHGYQWYESRMPETGNRLLSGEVSTSYFYNSDVPVRIKKYNPNIKLFVCLRNPVERVISNHRHEARCANVWGDNLTLLNALQNNPAYLMQSQYALHLKNWYKHFDREQLKVLFFDDLKDQPERFMKELYSFLEVDDSFLPENILKAANVGRIPASQFIEKSILSTGKFIRAIGLGPVVDIGRKTGLNDWLRSKNTSEKVSTEIEVTEEAINIIRASLKDDIKELSVLTSRDLTVWK